MLRNIFNELKLYNLQKNINEKFFFILISLLIFITVGDNLIDHKIILIFKILLILYTFIKLDLNFYQKIKSDVFVYRNISILISLFLVSITLSYIFSPFEINDFAFHWVRIRYLQVVSDIALFIAFFFYFKKIGINYDYLAYSIYIPGIIFSTLLISSIIIDKEILNNSSQMIFFDGIRQTGMILSLYVILISSYIFINYSLKYKFISFSLISFSLITLLLTLLFLFQGRGDFLSIIFTYVFIFTLFFKIKKSFKINLINIILIFLISFIFSQIIANYIYPIQFEIKETTARPSVFYTTDRILMWEYTISKFLENPLLGKGPGSYFIMSFTDVINGEYPMEVPHTQPHNMILQFLIEWGIIGTSIFLFLLTILFIKSLKILIKYKKLILLIPGTGIIKLAIHGMVDGTFYHPTFTFLLVLFLSILSHEVKKKDRL